VFGMDNNWSLQSNLPFYNIDDELLIKCLNDIPNIINTCLNQSFTDVSVQFFDKYNDVNINTDTDPDSNVNMFKAMGEMSCNYYTEDSITNVTKCFNNNSLSFFHHNIIGSRAHHNELIVYLKALNCEFTVIGLCEIWLKESNCDLYGIKGYVSEFKCRQGKSGSGVALYIKDSVNYNRRNDLESILNECAIECVFIEIQGKQFGPKPIVIGEIYRPPGSSVDSFNTYIETFLKSVNKEGKLCYLLGDYNINLINVHTHSPTENLVDIMFSQAFVPLINRPTRVTVNTATLIDHIYTNAIYDENYVYSSGILISALLIIFLFFISAIKINKNVKPNNR